MNVIKTLKQCVGIDVSMKKIDCCLSFYTPELQIKVVSTVRFENNLKGFTKLKDWISKKQVPGLPVYVNMEATGVYHEEAGYFIYSLGYKLSIIQPSKGKQYAKSLNEKNKTDKSDAAMLSRMGLERELGLWSCPNENLRILKRLSRERSGLIKDKNALTNKLHALEHSHQAFADCIERLKKRIKLILEQISEVEYQMESIVKGDSALCEKIRHVTTIPGVSYITAVSVVAETDGFSNIDNRKQLVSYAGLDVVLRESGTLSWRSHISKRGNSNIRSALYMSAVCSIIHNKDLNVYFNRLKNKGKPGKTGIIALSRKILILIFTLYRYNADFKLNHNIE